MTEHPHRARRVVARGTLSVALVLALSGALFAANAKFADAQETERHPQDIADLAGSQAERVERLAAQVDDLRSEVDALTEDGNADTAAVGTPGPGYVVESGAVAVTGPGLTVELDDAPVDSPLREQLDPDILVVHQQDLQSVMNALWAGGAEAMMLMDQRVISTSAFRCVGNVLRLHGRVYSPPYVVRAIGDPGDLRKGLSESPAVAGYVRDAKDVGLGWHVESSDRLELPAYSGATDLDAATVPEGVEILPGLEEADEAAKDAASQSSQSRKSAPPATGPEGPQGDDD